MSGSYHYGDRSPAKSTPATCRMDSCLLDPQQELLLAYKEDNIRYGNIRAKRSGIIGFYQGDDIFFSFIFLWVFVYMYLCRPSEASTRYCAIPGGYPPQD
jgi:hypothetical protein